MADIPGMTKSNVPLSGWYIYLYHHLYHLQGLNVPPRGSYRYHFTVISGQDAELHLELIHQVIEPIDGLLMGVVVDLRIVNPFPADIL